MKTLPRNPSRLSTLSRNAFTYFIVIEINSFRHSISQLAAQASENVGTRCLPIMRVTEPSGLQYGVDITYGVDSSHLTYLFCISTTEQ